MSNQDDQIRNFIAASTTEADKEAILDVLRRAREATTSVRVADPTGTVPSAHGRKGSYRYEFVPDWPTRIAAIRLHLQFLCPIPTAAQELAVSVNRAPQPSIAEQIDLLKRANCDVGAIIDGWIAAGPAHGLKDEDDPESAPRVIDL